MSDEQKIDLKTNFKIWHYSDFLILVVCRMFLTFSYQILGVIIGWHLYKMKSEPLWLGFLGLSEAIPAIITSIFAGYLVDTRKPAKLIQFSFTLGAFNSVLICLVIFIGNKLFTNQLIIFFLFFTVFMSGLIRSIASPAQAALIPTIIPRKHISEAMAFNSSSYTIAQIVGPAIGGLIYSYWGAEFAFFSPVIFSMASIILIFKLSAQTIMHQHHGIFSKEPMWKIIKQGFDYLFSQKTLLSTMLLDMFSVLFGGVVAVLPVFADQVFHTNATGLGFLRASPAVGSVLMSLFLSIKPMKNISGKRLLIVIFGFGLCMIGFSMTTHIYIALFWLMLSGVFDSISVVIRTTLIQLLTPQHLIGRVTGLARIFITSSNEIGAFESGVAAAALGLIPSVFFGGIMTLIVVVIINKWHPDLKNTQLDTHSK